MGVTDAESSGLFGSVVELPDAVLEGNRQNQPAAVGGCRSSAGVDAGGTLPGLDC